MRNRIRPFDILIIGIFLQCVVFALTQFFNFNGRFLYLATDTLLFLIVLHNQRVRTKAIGFYYKTKRVIRKCVALGLVYLISSRFQIKPNSLRFITYLAFFFIFCISVKLYWSRASGCTSTDVVCLVRFFGGSWDVQYSWLLRGFISSYVSSPSQVLSSLTWVSADYPILVPSILASLISIHVSLIKLIPIASVLICLLLVYYSCEFRRGHLFISLSLASTFLFYRIFNDLFFSLYPDLLISGLLLYVFINVENGKFDVNTLLCILIFPLVKREGWFYLVGLIFVLVFVYQIKVSLLLHLFWRQRTFTALIIILYGLQLSLGLFYGGNKLTNAMALPLGNIFDNLKTFFIMVIDKPWRYFYLMPVFAVLTPSGFTKVVNLLFSFMFIAYLFVLVMLPATMNLADFINVTFDRLVLQFYPLYVYASARYLISRYQIGSLSNLKN